MQPDPLRILQVSTRDVGGGAEKVAYDLFRAYRAQGLGSTLAVGFSSIDDPDIRTIPHELSPNPWSRFWWNRYRSLQPHFNKRHGVKQLCKLTQSLAEPNGWLDRHRGAEDFNFQGTKHLFDSQTPPPDVIHCHNLHGGYFDLRELPALSQRIPTFLTLHDAWLTSGHCAHSLDCERWQFGCGECPYLDLYPRIQRDATASNWQRKKAILGQCELFVATPCQWLMDKVHQSILQPAVRDSKIIPYGVDLSVFHPGPKEEVRRSLGLAPNAMIFLFAANGIKNNPWKDYKTLQEAVAQVAENVKRPLLFVALGEEAPPIKIGSAMVQFIPFQQSPQLVARYYQAADIYIHASRADTFPNSILEALACGLPVVATAVGGIPEQIKTLAISDVQSKSPFICHKEEESTGILTPSGDANAMANALLELTMNKELRLRLASNAARDAIARFDLDQQVDAYLDWYREVLSTANPGCSVQHQPESTVMTSLVSQAPCLAGSSL